MLYHEFRAMNTSILFAAEGQPKQVIPAFREVEELVYAYEQRFTRFVETSELCALNHSTGGWFEASPEMFELILLAKNLYRDTGGLFNPGVLEALESAGYDRSMESIRAMNYNVPELFRGPVLPGYFGQVRLDERLKAIHLPSGLRIDLGGIAKGWIAEQAARVLCETVSACLVDAGGDIFTCGLPAGEPGWSVAIEDPFDPDRDLAVLCVPPGAVATSSTTRRRWQQAGRERHHLIDPRSGSPATSAWVSVTVVSGQAAQAEALAKSFLIAGPERAANLLQSFPEIVMIAVDRAGKMWSSENIHKVIDEHAAKVST